MVLYSCSTYLALYAFSNVDWAKNVDNGSSTSAYVITQSFSPLREGLNSLLYGYLAVSCGNGIINIEN